MCIRICYNGYNWFCHQTYLFNDQQYPFILNEIKNDSEKAYIK